MYSRILVPVDGSVPSRCGLREALGLAADGRATVVLLHVAAEPALLMGAAGYVNYGELSDMLRRAGQEIVDDAAREAAKAGVPCETQVVDAGAGAVSDAIVDQASRQRCQLIVMGTHGRRGVRRLTLGSDAELVVRHAPVPVLLVKAPEGTA
ncbi:MAG TPA: universal stress protein [Burkholderiaceae bacterium]